MAIITLDGEGFGEYSIAGLQFMDGQAEVEKLTVKQAYLLQMLGAKVDGEVQILTPPAFEDETAPTPEPAAPAHSSADDLAAIGTDGSWDSIGEQATAEPQLEDVETAGLADDQYSQTPTADAPVTDPALDTPAVEPTPEPTVVETEGDAPTDVTPQPQEQQDAPADGSTDAEPTTDIPEPETAAEPTVDAQPVDAFPATAPDATTADDTETPEALESPIPDAPAPLDTDAPAPVISDAEDGSTVTEAAVLPEDDTTGRHVADDTATV